MHTLSYPKRCKKVGLAVALLTGLAATLLQTAQAVDLVNLASAGGPLVSALTTLGTLTPGIKALGAFLGFVAAFFALAALRNFSAALFYIGLVIFGAVALVVGGAILGAVI